jgi:acyl carrier protein
MNDEKRKTIIDLLVEASDKPVTAADVSAATTLRDDLALDSLEAIQLVLDLEEKFGIRVDDTRIKGLRTVGDVFALVDEHAPALVDGPAA